MSKFFAFVFVFFLFVGVGSVCVGQLVSDSSIISMSGKDWSLKVDSVLASSIDSRNTPYMTAKSATEKELFLELATLEDCKSGVVQFKIDMQGLTAYKQLPLTQEEIDEGSFRPKNVENSFALFDGSGRKVAHIYGSKITDSKGAEVWLDQELTEGLLTVYLPKPEELATLTFPLLLDPTFGYSSIGGTEHSSIFGWVLGSNFSLTEAGTPQEIIFYNEYDSNATVKVAIYDDNGTEGSPSARLVLSASEVCLPNAWHNFTITSSELDIGIYYLMFRFESAGSAAYDGGAYGWQVESNLDNPLVGGESNANKYSIYVEYTVSGEPTPTPSPSPSSVVSVSPFPSPSVTVLSVADWGLVLEIVMLVACFVSFVWLGKVPMVPLLVGLFAFLVSLYFALSGFWSGYAVVGFFSVFVALVGGLEMLLVGLGVRVRR